MTSPVAASWRELLARHAPAARALIEQDLQDFSNIAEREAAKLPSAFAGEDSVLARGILACGRPQVAPLIQLMHPMLVPALGALTEDDLQNSLAAKRILSFALLAEGTGIKTPDGFDAAPLAALVVGRKDLSDRQQRSAALLALALGDPATARALIDAGPASYAQPVVRFEFNLYELVRYLAHVIEHRQPADWIEPAWGEYLAGFPLHLAADAAEWPDVFYFARVLANLRGDRVGDIADDLHARVRLLASRGQ